MAEDFGTHLKRLSIGCVVVLAAYAIGKAVRAAIKFVFTHTTAMDVAQGVVFLVFAYILGYSLEYFIEVGYDG